LVAVSFSKSIDLIFYTWTIPGSYPINPSGKHGTSVESCFQDIMNFLVGIGYPTAFLFGGFLRFQERKTGYHFIAWLLFHS